MHRTTLLRTTAVAGMGLAAAMLTGCSTGASGTTPTTVGSSAIPEASTSASPPATSAAPASSAPAGTTSAAPASPATPAEPAPPPGATKLASSDEGGVSYAHYSIQGSSPEQVVKDYESQARSDGYSIVTSGGGGGGWGRYGGSNYGMEAEKDSSYLAVQAGGRTGGTTYFEVCVGTSEAAVDRCEQHSQHQDG